MYYSYNIIEFILYNRSYKDDLRINANSLYCIYFTIYSIHR